MGLFSFIKEAGEKLFGGKDAQAATAAAPTQDELNAKASKAIETYIAAQNLGASNVQVAFEGPEGKVTVKGTAPTQAAKEKITLCCGNVAGVTSVENVMEGLRNRARRAIVAAAANMPPTMIRRSGIRLASGAAAIAESIDPNARLAIAQPVCVVP